MFVCAAVSFFFFFLRQALTLTRVFSTQLDLCVCRCTVVGWWTEVETNLLLDICANCVALNRGARNPARAP